MKNSVLKLNKTNSALKFNVEKIQRFEIQCQKKSNFKKLCVKKCRILKLNAMFCKFRVKNKKYCILKWSKTIHFEITKSHKNKVF